MTPHASEYEYRFSTAHSPAQPAERPTEYVILADIGVLVLWYAESAILRFSSVSAECPLAGKPENWLFELRRRPEGRPLFEHFAKAVAKRGNVFVCDRSLPVRLVLN